MIQNINELLDVEITVPQGMDDTNTMTIREALLEIGVQVTNLSDTQDKKYLFFQISELTISANKQTPVDAKKSAILKVVTASLRKLGNEIYPDNNHEEKAASDLFAGDWRD